MKNKVTLKTYIDNINAGVTEENIIMAALDAGISEEEAKIKIEQAKAEIEKRKQKQQNKDKKKETNIKNESQKADEQNILLVKQSELIDILQSAKELCDEIKELRRQSNLSNTGHANLSRELNDEIKFAQRYVIS